MNIVMIIGKATYQNLLTKPETLGCSYNSNVNVGIGFILDQIDQHKL